MCVCVCVCACTTYEKSRMSEVIEMSAGELTKRLGEQKPQMTLCGGAPIGITVHDITELHMSWLDHCGSL